MNEEKRMIETYEVRHAVHLGDREIVFAEDATADYPYLVSDYTSFSDFGLGQYSNVRAGDDYLEMMVMFTERVNTQIAQVLTERKQRGVGATALTQAHCLHTGMEKSLVGQVLVVKPTSLRPEYATADHQLVLATGGNGYTPDARGSAVFCTTLYSGKRGRWERSDVLGVADLGKLPRWARDAAHKLKAAERRKEGMER